MVGRDSSQYNLEVIKDEGLLKERLFNSALTFIDIPIGLHSKESPRTCDSVLRKKLGPSYANSVFNVPVRDAVYAETYRSACDINERITGKKISRQIWNIVPRIRQVDSLLQHNRSLRDKVKECHPEWLLKLMNGEDIPEKKNTYQGLESRKRLLLSRGIPVDELEAKLRKMYYKKEAKTDDLLDALVLNYVAWQVIFEGKDLKSLPVSPTTDEKDLKMAIFYADI